MNNTETKTESQADGHPGRSHSHALPDHAPARQGDDKQASLEATPRPADLEQASVAVEVSSRAEPPVTGASFTENAMQVDSPAAQPSAKEEEATLTGSANAASSVDPGQVVSAAVKEEDAQREQTSKSESTERASSPRAQSQPRSARQSSPQTAPRAALLPQDRLAQPVSNGRRTGGLPAAGPRKGAADTYRPGPAGREDARDTPGREIARDRSVDLRRTDDLCGFISLRHSERVFHCFRSWLDA